MNVRLVVEHGARRKVVNLRPPEAILGRSHGNTVRIPSADVSRRHCRLLLQDGLVTLEDLGSVNGTFLNGRRVDGAEVVRPGDALEVGPVSFVVEYELTPEALARLRALSGNQDDMLAALAEGDVGDDLPILAALADGDPAAEDDNLPVLEAAEEEMVEAIPISEEGPLQADFDFDAKPWQMPEGGDLRDILSQMEDEEPPTQHRAPKRY
jgi:pSer/pThr/pTyr-binding forkhead associated (FHA) protein